MLHILLGILTVGFLLVAFLPLKYANYISSLAYGFSCIAFVQSLALIFFFNIENHNCFQFVSEYPLSLGLDGMSLFFVLLTSFLFPLCLLASWGPMQTKSYLLCFLGIEILLILVFSVRDLVYFYVFFESVLMPMFFLIGIWGSRARKIRASYFFFVYTLVGSLFLLCAITYIVVVCGTSRIESLSLYDFSMLEHKLLWLGFFLSFAVKVPLVPFHIWLPEAHVEAPTAGSAILAGILLKLGIYGFLRFSIGLFCYASFYYAPFIICLSLVGVVYTSLTAIRQTDLKRIIAYTSVAHISLVVCALFCFGDLSMSFAGAIFQSLSHGFVSCALFLLIGCLYDRYHTRFYIHYGGLVHTIPLFAIFFVIFTIANIALPGTSTFVGEFLLLLGIFETNGFAAFVGASTIVSGGIYSLWLLNRVIYGNIKTQSLKIFTDLNKREFIVLSLCVALTIFLGIYPESVLHVIENQSF